MAARGPSLFRDLQRPTLPAVPDLRFRDRVERRDMVAAILPLQGDGDKERTIVRARQAPDQFNLFGVLRGLADIGGGADDRAREGKEVMKILRMTLLDVLLRGGREHDLTGLQFQLKGGVDRLDGQRAKGKLNEARLFQSPARLWEGPDAPSMCSPASTKDRTAAGRVGFGSGCAAIQASRAARSGRSIRTLTASLSTGGRPLDFLAPEIDMAKY